MSTESSEEKKPKLTPEERAQKMKAGREAKEAKRKLDRENHIKALQGNFRKSDQNISADDLKSKVNAVLDKEDAIADCDRKRNLYEDAVIKVSKLSSKTGGQSIDDVIKSLKSLKEAQKTEWLFIFLRWYDMSMIIDCAKNACREKANKTCGRCKTDFCSLHINDHEEICSTE